MCKAWQHSKCYGNACKNHEQVCARVYWLTSIVEDRLLYRYIHGILGYNFKKQLWKKNQT